MSDMRIAELEAQNEALQRRLTEAETRALQAETAAAKATVASRLRVATVAANAKPEAVEALVNHFMLPGHWKVNSVGELLHEREPNKPSVNTKGDYISPEEWVAEVKKREAANPDSWVKNCFNDGQAGGSKSSNGETNPWMPHSWNLTQQGRVLSMSKSDAERMAREAGSPLYATQPPQPSKGA